MTNSNSSLIEQIVQASWKEEPDSVVNQDRVIYLHDVRDLIEQEVEALMKELEGIPCAGLSSGLFGEAIWRTDVAAMIRKRFGGGHE